MSKTQAQIGISISHMVSFMKEKTASNLAEASSSDGLLAALSVQDIERIINVVNASIDQSFSLGYTGVENAINAALESR